MKKKRKIFIAVIPAVLLVLFMIFEPFFILDSMTSDLLYRQMDGCDNRIKIISIDEKTLSAYGPLSTWSRQKTAELIEKLYETKELKPAVLGIDMMFIGETEKEKDTRLAQAAMKAGSVVVATNLVYRGQTKYTAEGMVYYDSRNIELEERPYAELDQAVSSGYANTMISPDGYVRLTQLYTTVQNETRYSFATEIYREYSEQSGANTVEPLPANKEVQFFYAGKPGEIAHYSLVDVLEGKIPQQEFAGNIVLVGAYAAGLQDAYHSAADRGQNMYGVEINANIVNALMHGKTAIPMAKWMIIPLLALLLWGYTYLAREMKMYPAIIVGIWLLLAAGIAGRILAANGYLISLFYFFFIVLLIWGWIVIEKYVYESIKRRQTLNSFKKYMAPQVIDSLMKDGNFKIELTGEKRNVAVLFVDIRGFTTMSEILQPEQIVKILNQYLSLTTSCIFEHGGMLDKFIGDATMAIFNAPTDQEDYVYQAVLAGIDMRDRGRLLGEELQKEFGRSVSFGVGIHVGDAVVGNIGCSTRMDYTAIGDTVNTASRIEGKSKASEVLISEAVYTLLKDRIDAEFKEDMLLKGKAEPVRVYSVKGTK